MPRKSGGTAAHAAQSTDRAYVSSETPGKIQSNGKDKAAAESAALDLLEDEDDLPIGDQLDRMEDKIEEEQARLKSRHRGRSAESDDETQDGESVEEPVQETQGEGEVTSKLLGALSTVTERMAQLEQRIVAISEGKSDDDESEEIPYDVGEIEEGFEALKPTLNAMGKQLYAEVQQQKRAIQGLAQSVRAAIDEIHVDRIREKYQIGSKEEDDIVAWAKDIGIAYENPRQLAKTVELYRDTHKQQAKPATKPARAAETKPTGARSFDEDLVRKPGRRTFDDSFAHAVRTVNKTIRERGIGAL